MCNALDIAKITKIISIAYPNWQPTAETNEVYYRLLQDIPTEELRAAVLHCVAENGRKFAPSVGEIRGAVGELRKASNNVPTTYEAWQEVLRQISEVGSYGTPVFCSSLIHRVVRQLGWRNLCLSEDQTADRARFVQAYEQLLHRAETEEMLLPEVRGYIESQGGLLLDVPSQIKKLSARLSK